VGDGFTPVTALTLSGADEAELLKAAGAATVSIAASTFAAITGADGWYDLTLTTTDTNTIGTLDVVVNDDSLILPIHARFQVIEEAAYDAIYAASAAPATAAGVSAVETKVDTVDTNVDAILVDTGTTLQGELDGIQTTVDAILVDTGTTLQAELDAIQAAVITNAAGVDIAADIIALKAETAAILADTDVIGAAGAGLTALATQASVTAVDDLVDTEVAAIKTVVDAIQAKTDSLTFTAAGQVDANIQSVNDVPIVGDGSGTPFNV
jgi:hypothetical protein